MRGGAQGGGVGGSGSGGSKGWRRGESERSRCRVVRVSMGVGDEGGEGGVGHTPQSGGSVGVGGEG